ncbi:hypothetical protein PROFUN_16191 [Planoprotostelium fungivorum]|uniref:Uncharacterized protein n=1 Tax=Planoprotostelium fungivorum TaxID=1890364 RepID=A0A2P6MS17_9EUKA|nr:hypothetical protein PROFUN_16191 [Planoprotostelium fungivorum]
MGSTQWIQRPIPYGRKYCLAYLSTEAQKGLPYPTTSIYIVIFSFFPGFPTGLQSPKLSVASNGLAAPNGHEPEPELGSNRVSLLMNKPEKQFCRLQRTQEMLQMKM